MSSTSRKFGCTAYAVAKVIDTHGQVSTSNHKIASHSLNTSRKEGIVKVRIAPREIPVSKKDNSTV